MIDFARMSNHREHDEIACAIREGFSRLASAIEGLAGNNNVTQILNRITLMEGNIMSAISDFAAKQKAFNDRQGAAIDAVVASAAGLTSDVKSLNDQITALQNSQGGVTPEDQALIDGLETQGDALATKLEGVSSALAALDAQTPPVVPPTP